MYLKNMIEFDNLGDDSKAQEKGCSIYKTYNFLCKNYFPEYYIEGPADTLNDYDLFCYNRVYELFDKLSDEDIELILKETNVYPKYIYGLKNNDGTGSYFDCAYTRIIKIKCGPETVVLFECFKSELVDLVGKSGSLTSIRREVIFIYHRQFLIRSLDICIYLIYDLDDDGDNLVMHSCCDNECDDNFDNQFDDFFNLLSK
jgi:hypothetical protein